MTSMWVVITQAGATRRQALPAGPFRIGGGEAEVTLAGVGTDQLLVECDPLRVKHVGTGAPPFCAGAPLTERTLTPGEWIEWAGARLEFEQEAALEEVAPPPVATSAATGGGIDERTWQRVKAGLLVDLGRADKKAVKRWQKAVVDGGFDADAAARELVEGTPAIDEAVLRDRAGRLMRDFLMAPLMRGARGAGRAVRQGARGLAAMLISQAVALLVYSVIVVLSMLALRYKGTSFDGFCDAILAVFGLEAGGGGGGG